MALPSFDWPRVVLSEFHPQIEEGVWFLEDLSSVIQLDLSEAQSYHLFFTEGSQVVLQGFLSNGVFKVQVLSISLSLSLLFFSSRIVLDQVLGLPFAEDRESSLRALGLSDSFGLGLSSQQYESMLQLERSAETAILVILSDVQLDKPLVRRREEEERPNCR